MPIIKEYPVPPNEPRFKEGYSLPLFREPPSALEYTKAKLELLEKGLGSDNPAVKQLRKQIAVIEEGKCQGGISIPTAG